MYGILHYVRYSLEIFTDTRTKKLGQLEDMTSHDI